MSGGRLPAVIHPKPPWNRGRILREKRPLLPKPVRALRVRLGLSGTLRDLAIDSAFGGCDLVRLKLGPCD